MAPRLQRLRSALNARRPEAPQPPEPHFSCQCLGCDLHRGNSCRETFLSNGRGRPRQFCSACRNERRRWQNRSSQDVWRRKHSLTYRVRKFVDRSVRGLLKMYGLRGYRAAFVRELRAIYGWADPLYRRPLRLAYTCLYDTFSVYIVYDPTLQHPRAHGTLVRVPVRAPGLEGNAYSPVMARWDSQGLSLPGILLTIVVPEKIPPPAHCEMISRNSPLAEYTEVLHLYHWILVTSAILELAEDQSTGKAKPPELAEALYTHASFVISSPTLALGFAFEWDFEKMKREAIQW